MEWMVEVVDSEQQNAFCLPGGKIVVYTGILPIAETDAGLAVVMGHEISHALAHHGAERMAQQQMAQIGVMAAGGAMGDMDPEPAHGRHAGDQRRSAVRHPEVQPRPRKRSRPHGPAAHGRRPATTRARAAKFWERMQQVHRRRNAPPEFLSTHPSHDTRIRDLEGVDCPKRCSSTKLRPRSTRRSRCPTRASAARCCRGSSTISRRAVATLVRDDRRCDDPERYRLLASSSESAPTALISIASPWTGDERPSRVAAERLAVARDRVVRLRQLPVGDRHRNRHAVGSP